MIKFFMRGLALLVLAGFLSCGGTTSTASPTASLPLPENETAEIVTAGAGSTSQAATSSSPTLSFLKKGSPANRIIYSITGCTFDSSSSEWGCSSQASGVTLALKFYKVSDGSLITVDVTEAANYFPGGQLFGVSPPGTDDTGVQVEISVAVERTLGNGTVLSFNTTTGKLTATDANTDSTATFTHTGTGSIAGTFTPQIIDSEEATVALTLSSVTFTASNLGSSVAGTYEFSGTVDDTTFTGTVAFDEDGCNGATIKDEDGNTLGTAALDDEGALIFIDSEDNETTLERLDA